jgi:hypothetical protein
MRFFMPNIQSNDRKKYIRDKGLSIYFVTLHNHIECGSGLALETLLGK